MKEEKVKKQEAKSRSTKGGRGNKRMERCEVMMKMKEEKGWREVNANTGEVRMSALNSKDKMNHCSSLVCCV